MGLNKKYKFFIGSISGKEILIHSLMQILGGEYKLGNERWN